MDLKQTLIARAALRDGIGTYLRVHGYLEIDTPVLVHRPGTEVHLGYFSSNWRDHRGTLHPYWLRSSPELHMKIALAGGVERIFQFATCFRNDGELGPQHRPEFTMLEYYETGIGFEAFIARTENMIRAGLETLRQHVPQARHFDLPASVPRISVFDAFRDFAGIDLVDEDPGLAGLCRAAGVESVRADDDFETAFFKALMEKIEPALARWPAAVLLDYPPSQAALSQVVGGRAKRFEIYARRVELCNGFLELLDPAANRQRLQEADDRRRQLGKEVTGEEPDFLRALEAGLPPCCGNALGFDRLLMLALGAKDIAAARGWPFP